MGWCRRSVTTLGTFISTRVRSSPRGERRHPPDRRQAMPARGA
jgi:hypothetical protein